MSQHDNEAMLASLPEEIKSQLLQMMANPDMTRQMSEMSAFVGSKKPEIKRRVAGMTSDDKSSFVTRFKESNPSLMSRIASLGMIERIQLLNSLPTRTREEIVTISEINASGYDTGVASLTDVMER